jgi:hypothetical protein
MPQAEEPINFCLIYLVNQKMYLPRGKKPCLIVFFPLAMKPVVEILPFITVTKRQVLTIYSQACYPNKQVSYTRTLAWELVLTCRFITSN